MNHKSLGFITIELGNEIDDEKNITNFQSEDVKRYFFEKINQRIKSENVDYNIDKLVLFHTAHDINSDLAVFDIVGTVDVVDTDILSYIYKQNSMEFRVDIHCDEDDYSSLSFVVRII